MNQERRRFSIITFIALCFILSFGFCTKVKADSPSTSYTVNLRLYGNFTGDFVFNIPITNYDNNNVISGYQIKFPYPKIYNVITKLNGVSKKYSITKNSTSSTIKIDFGPDIIRNGSQAYVQISFRALNILTDFYSAKKLYIPLINSGAPSQNINYIIVYPAELGSLLFTSSLNPNQSDFDVNNKRLVVQSNRGLLLIWGDKISVDVKSLYTISNEKDELTHNLVPLIPDFKNQKTLYKEVYNGNFGLVDNLTNTYSLVELNSGENKDVGFSARVNINQASTDSTYPDTYNWLLDYHTSEGEKIYNEMNKGSDNLGKLKNVNDYLVSKLSPYKDEKIDFDRITNIWQRLEGNSNFSSFEYCYLIIASAESLGLKARIDYGYLILNTNGDIDISMPHIWCEVEIDGKNVQFDPYLEDLEGVSYFDQNQIDRIKFGTWHPNQSYNNVLGLIGSSKIKPSLKVVPIDHLAVNNPEVTMDLDLPDNAYSGEYYKAEAFINNNTNLFIKVNSLTLNGEDINDNINYKDFKFGLLPMQSNKIELLNLREKNFFYNGEENINLAASLDNANFSKASTSGKVTFTPDNRLIIVPIVFLVVVIVSFVIIIRRLSRARFSRGVKFRK